MNVKLKRYETLEEVQAALMDTSVDQLSEYVIGTVDEAGEETEHSPDDVAADIKEYLHIWGYSKDRVIHYWVDSSCSRENLIRFFAHELGHMTGTSLEDVTEEEARAERYAQVAVQAEAFANDVSASFEHTEEANSERDPESIPKSTRSGKHYNSVLSMVYDMYTDEITRSESLAKKLFSLNSRMLFKAASSKAKSIAEKEKLPDKVVHDVDKVLQCMEESGFLPAGVTFDNIDGTELCIRIDFDTCDRFYRIYVDEKGCTFEKGTAKAFLRKVAGTVEDSEYEVKELLCVEDVQAGLCLIKKDSLESRIDFVRGLLAFKENWDINYPRSGTFSNIQVRNAERVLETAEETGVVILGVFPAIHNFKTGEPVIHIELAVSETVYTVKLYAGGDTALLSGVYLGDRRESHIESSSMSLEECLRKLFGSEV